MEIPAGYILIKESDFNAILARLAELESRAKKTSNNSHKPPSSDGYKKVVKNNRERSDKKRGAQPGHPGNTLKMVSTPDKVIPHKLFGQCECGENLEALELKSIQRKQEFELPAKLIEVIEHQIEVKQCTCGKIHQAACELNGNAQYGSSFKALMVYLNQYQLIPFERLQELSRDCFGISISDGVLAKSNQICYDQLASTEEIIKTELIRSKVIHNDETGVRCEDKTRWVHSTSTDLLTHYSIQNKRGTEAMDAIGILPQFEGKTVHDRWASYDKYTSCIHSGCNAHLLRELKYVNEEQKCLWALPMKQLLTTANNLKKQDKLSPIVIEDLELKYQKIVRKGLKEEAKHQIRDKPKRGRTPQAKSKLLLDVFTFKSERVLLFLYDNEVPFDNNLAERDLRMLKLKQKISGCFRTTNGAQIFCRIRSYISSVRKQGYNVLAALENALTGNPVSLIAAEQ
jgi:transposase